MTTLTKKNYKMTKGAVGETLQKGQQKQRDTR